MPPRASKKAKNSILDLQLAEFVENAVMDFKIHEKNGRISRLKLRQICASHNVPFPSDTLLPSDAVIDEPAFRRLLCCLKQESDLSGLEDYIYRYLCYAEGGEAGSTEITPQSLYRAFKTLPRAPKRGNKVRDMFCYAAGAEDAQCISREQFKDLLRRVNFFADFYQADNVDESVLAGNKES